MELQYWTHQLNDLQGRPGELVSPVENHTGFYAQWKSGKDRYFVKCYPGDLGVEIGKAEINGLLILHSTGILKIPQIYSAAEVFGGFVLIMEWIPQKTGAAAPQWEKAGEQLATMHSNPVVDEYGLTFDNFIGRLPQSNTIHHSWPEFFRNERLHSIWEPVAPMFPVTAHRQMDKLLERLPGLLDYQGRPALLHGDLWKENLLFNDRGQPVFIDPAVYQGAPEVDLAMTRLFGGFPPEFYDAYYEILNQEPGWEDRQDLYQLYYLLVHVHLFGENYLPACNAILKKFGS